ncbi:MAG: glycosyltransferase [Nostoc sp. S4]|nr:glycosyltransferase [Nostoc sp. S4]
MIIVALKIVLLVAIAASVAFYIWCGICLVWFRTSLKRKISVNHQPVSLLVPVCGVDEDARENWASFCQQDYENYEVLFGVMNLQDPAVPILEELVAKFGDRAQLHFCLEVRGINHKISNLMHLLEFAQHEIVIFADSDICVSPNYLSTVTEPLCESSVGVVTCGYLDHTPKVFGAALASLGRCIDFIPSVLVARSLDRGLRFAIGPTIATRKSVLADIGGLQSVLNRIGIDYHIGKMAADAGYRVKLSEYILQNNCGRETLEKVFLRELRWAKTIRLNYGLKYYSIGLTYGTVYCIPLLLLGDFQSWAVIVSFATFAIRVIQVLIAIQCLDCPKLLWWLWLLPIRELLNFAIWFGGCFGQSVNWRGRVLYISAGGLLTD